MKSKTIIAALLVAAMLTSCAEASNEGGRSSRRERDRDRERETTTTVEETTEETTEITIDMTSEDTSFDLADGSLTSETISPYDVFGSSDSEIPNIPEVELDDLFSDEDNLERYYEDTVVPVLGTNVGYWEDSVELVWDDYLIEDYVSVGGAVAYYIHDFDHDYTSEMLVFYYSPDVITDGGITKTYNTLHVMLCSINDGGISVTDDFKVGAYDTQDYNGREFFSIDSGSICSEYVDVMVYASGDHDSIIFNGRELSSFFSNGTLSSSWMMTVDQGRFYYESSYVTYDFDGSGVEYTWSDWRNSQNDVTATPVAGLMDDSSFDPYFWFNRYGISVNDSENIVNYGGPVTVIYRQSFIHENYDFDTGVLDYTLILGT